MTKHLLYNVEYLVASSGAFAVLRKDGRVIPWGCSHFGGDAYEKDVLLNNVEMLAASDYAFAALKNTGRIICWGMHYDLINAKKALQKVFS